MFSSPHLMHLDVNNLSMEEQVDQLSNIVAAEAENVRQMVVEFSRQNDGGADVQPGTVQDDDSLVDLVRRMEEQMMGAYYAEVLRMM